MNVKSRHHLRSDAVDAIERALSDGLGVELAGETYERVEFTDAERDQRITGDPYPADETVAIVDQFVGDAFAYHELDADNHSLCTLQTDNPLAYRTRAEAQDDQYAPCQLCQRLRQKREAEQ